MYAEADLLPLSALQHWAVCRRQAALIHLEQLWSENLHTAEGRIAHQKVDTVFREKRRGLKTAFGLRIRSLELGLAGRADVVEFHQQDDGSWRPYPVEHKRGRAKADACDRIQLCAQAMCLEEMLATHVPAGALFYGKTRRREEVVFDEKLRAATSEAAKAMHDMLAQGRTPPATVIPRCKGCSLGALCLPKICDGSRSVHRYLLKALREP